MLIKIMLFHGHYGLIYQYSLNYWILLATTLKLEEGDTAFLATLVRVLNNPW